MLAYAIFNQHDSTYRRAQDGMEFAFDTQPSTDYDVALVLQETACTSSLDTYLPIARTAAPRICVVQSKIDLVPHDWSWKHVNSLGFAVWCRHTYKVECLLVSTMSGDGIDGLLNYLGVLFITLLLTIFTTNIAD